MLLLLKSTKALFVAKLDCRSVHQPWVSGKGILENNLQNPNLQYCHQMLDFLDSSVQPQPVNNNVCIYVQCMWLFCLQTLYLLVNNLSDNWLWQFDENFMTTVLMGSQPTGLCWAMALCQSVVSSWRMLIKCRKITHSSSDISHIV